MANDDITGTDWSDAENDAIVADYFSMLADELARKPFNKAEHNRWLQQLIGRTRGSIERKHQNISAVLRKLGEPWIVGYKPLPNYQAGLIDAIDRYLSGRRQATFEQPSTRSLMVAEPGAIFVDQPDPFLAGDMPPPLRHIARKFDPAERDARNRALGRSGEEFVIDLERSRLVKAGREDLATSVRWVANEDDSAGYDVQSYEPTGARLLIEVKTTTGAAETPFFLTRKEYRVAGENPQDWCLYRVHLFARDPRIFRVRPPLETNLALSPETWRARVGQGRQTLVE